MQELWHLFECRKNTFKIVSRCGGSVSYPEQIMDRNGNYILISYLGWGVINTITDTLGRYVTFNYEYDSSQDCSGGYSAQCFRNARKLVSIGSPSGNTGQITQSTDQNGQVTTYEYYPDTKRLYRVTRPDGGTIIMEYGDLLYADPDQSHLHSWTKTTTSIEGSMVAEEWKYIDGRGQVVRTFGTQTGQGRATRDIEYDAMGRVVRNSNPYYSSSGAASPINPAGLWGTRLYDSFSRVTQLIAGSKHRAGCVCGKCSDGNGPGEYVAPASN